MQLEDSFNLKAKDSERLQNSLSNFLEEEKQIFDSRTLIYPNIEETVLFIKDKLEAIQRNGTLSPEAIRELQSSPERLQDTQDDYLAS